MDRYDNAKRSEQTGSPCAYIARHWLWPAHWDSRVRGYGTLGMTWEWLLQDKITPAETIVQMMFNSMPESLRKLYFSL